MMQMMVVLKMHDNPSMPMKKKLVIELNMHVGEVVLWDHSAQPDYGLRLLLDYEKDKRMMSNETEWGQSFHR